MAQLVPSSLSRLALEGAHKPELAALRILEKGLSNDYTVFHGVHWSREYESWTHFGEIDFVVLNRAGEVLFIEQKNGRLLETNEGLAKRYGSIEKNVVQQLYRSVNKVREKFQWQHGRNPSLVIEKLIYCPDYTVEKLNAAGLAEKHVVDAAATDGLTRRIESLLSPGEETHYGWGEKVKEFFFQTFDLVPDIHTYKGSQERQFVRQTGALADILTNLEMEPFRLRIRGGAGTGKSLFARRFLQREANASRRILLTCFNRPLADRLKDSVGNTGVVSNFHKFCDDFMKSQGEALDYGLMKTDPNFWQNVMDRITLSKITEEERFDSLIVDEGQDFDSEWYEILRLFLKKNANILWLEDPEQNLYEKPPVDLKEFVTYNTRVKIVPLSPLPRVHQENTAIAFEQGNDLPGLGVAVNEYSEAEQQPKIVANIVRKLIAFKFRPEDIVILSCESSQESVFRHHGGVGGISLCRFTDKYNDRGEQIRTDGKLTFDSVKRFKGQESPVVILVDVDPESTPKGIVRAERVLFCGMTRATVRLEMVVKSDNDYNRRFLDQSDADNGMKENDPGDDIDGNQT